MSIDLNRRTMLAGAAALTPTLAFAQRAQQPSVITNPPRQWGPGAPPASYPDPDVIVIDPDLAWILDPDELKSKCKNTPFDEAKMTGRVIRTIVAGRTAYEYA